MNDIRIKLSNLTIADREDIEAYLEANYLHSEMSIEEVKEEKIDILDIMEQHNLIEKDAIFEELDGNMIVENLDSFLYEVTEEIIGRVQRMYGKGLRKDNKVMEILHEIMNS